MRAFLAALLLVGGCGFKTHYTWSSERGQRCFAGCRAQRERCGSVCGDPERSVGRDEKHQIVACHRGCLAAERGCFEACPDVRRVYDDGKEVYPGPVYSDIDCWRLGICKRGECLARGGNCVKR